MSESHDDRVARLRAGYREAHERFVKRVHGAPRDLVVRVPAAGGWSVAQIAWHVAAVDDVFATLMSGERGTRPLPEAFVERSWAEVVARIPARLDAAGAVVPPPSIDVDAVRGALEAAAAKIDSALEALTPERGGGFGVTHAIVGTITLYQVGEWATAHTIRHNAQAKRVLAEFDRT